MEYFRPGQPQDAEGIDFVLTITFDSPTSGTTHVGGSLDANGMTCAVDRPGTAERIG